MIEDTQEGKVTEKEVQEYPDEDWKQLSLPFVEAHLRNDPPAKENKQNGNPD